MSKIKSRRALALPCAVALAALLLLQWPSQGSRARRSFADAFRALANERVAVEDHHDRAPRVSAAHAQTSQQQQRQSSQQPSGGKTVDQTRKNIQVLKGLPDEQLFPLMNFIGVSLGVQCNYCHVRSGERDFDWASDEKPAKQTARRMMRMVLDVNRTNAADFRNSAVTCYTCHQGKTQPASLPPLPVVRSAPEPGASAAPSSAGQPAVPPSAERIVSRYVEAVGGADAASRLGGRVFKGTAERSQGRSGPLEVTILGEDKFLAVATLPQGTVMQALDGSGGWIKTPNPQRAKDPSAPEFIVRPLNAAEMAGMRGARSLFDVIKVDASGAGMKFVGTEQIGGRTALVTEMTTPEGATRRFYFDSETGLLVRRLTLTPALLFSIPEQIDYEDYRDVGGVKVPFTIRVSTVEASSSSTRRFTEVRHHVTVDESVFKMPSAPSK